LRWRTASSALDQQCQAFFRRPSSAPKLRFFRRIEAIPAVKGIARKKRDGAPRCPRLRKENRSRYIVQGFQTERHEESVMVLQRLFSVHPPENGPFKPDSVVASEPKRIFVNGKPVDGWIITVKSDEDEVHLMLENIEDVE